LTAVTTVAFLQTTQVCAKKTKLSPNECLSTAKNGWEDVGRRDIRIEDNHDNGDEINTPVICRGWMLQTSRPSGCTLSVRYTVLHELSHRQAAYMHTSLNEHKCTENIVYKRKPRLNLTAVTSAKENNYARRSVTELISHIRCMEHGGTVKWREKQKPIIIQNVRPM
jgi:hypothetical protein